MTSQVPSGDKPAVRRVSKRTVQPVLPALPQIPPSKRTAQSILPESKDVVNGTSDHDSNRASRSASSQPPSEKRGVDDLRGDFSGNREVNGDGAQFIFQRTASQISRLFGFHARIRLTHVNSIFLPRSSLSTKCRRLFESSN